MYKLSEDYSGMFRGATAGLVRYIREHDIQCLVLGVSGGIDSALVAALADAATDYPFKKIPVIGRSITIESNKADEIARAKLVGERFCDDFKELDLTKAYCDILHQLDMSDDCKPTVMEAKIALGNIKARIRMIQLYNLAGIHKGMVLSTDNYTELLLGFWTLHGDVGDYGMVQNLWKTEVYGLARYMAEKYDQLGQTDKANSLINCCNAVPTDGLGITDSDLDQLGAKSYNEVDEILITHLNNKLKHDMSLLDSPVVRRYENTHFKRENPYNIPREELIS